ncbi:MAG: hypothetical protein IKU98_01470 [Bacteroidaceae bacterium]|nr:hypothetical protein [Bacteroidaceae bacterium]
MNIRYTLYDDDGEFQFTSTPDKIISDIVGFIAEKTRASAIYEYLDGYYGGIEIDGNYYGAGTILDAVGDLGDVFAKLYANEIKEIALPTIWDTKQYELNVSWETTKFSIHASMNIRYDVAPWESPEVPHPLVTKASDVPILNAKFPHATVWEWCSYCESEVIIPAYRESHCPECGHEIIPCSMCDCCTRMDKCPY